MAGLARLRLFDLLPRFKNYMRVSTRLAQTSQDSYVSQLRAFMRDVKNPRLEEMTPGKVVEWMALMHDGGLSKKTVELRLTAAKRFWEWLDDFEEEPTAPKLLKAFKRMEIPLDMTSTRDPARALDGLELTNVFETASGHRAMGKRDRAMVELAYNTGIRRSSLHSITLGDVDLPHMRIDVVEKGAKLRTVFFGEECRETLKIWIRDRDSIPARPGVEQLFISNRGTAMSLRTINRLFKDIGEEAGLHFDFYPHQMRHTKATELLDNGASLAAAGKILGHVKPETTMRYHHPKDQNLQDADHAAREQARSRGPARA